jgi:hypothetical protein
MIDEAVVIRLRAYIKEHYILNGEYPFLMTNKDGRLSCRVLQKYSLTHSNAMYCRSFSNLSDDVKEFIKEKRKPETFAVLLKRKMREKGITSKETYESAGIDRKLFSKINTNDNYHPNKSTVIALGLS